MSDQHSSIASGSRNRRQSNGSRDSSLSQSRSSSCVGSSDDCSRSSLYTSSGRSSPVVVPSDCPANAEILQSIDATMSVDTDLNRNRSLTEEVQILSVADNCQCEPSDSANGNAEAKVRALDLIQNGAGDLQPAERLLGSLQAIISETEDSLSAVVMNKKGREVAEELSNELSTYRAQIREALDWANTHVGVTSGELTEQNRLVEEKNFDVAALRRRLETTQEDLKNAENLLQQNQTELNEYQSMLERQKRNNRRRKRRSRGKALLSAGGGLLCAAASAVFPPAAYAAGACAASSGLFATKMVFDAKQGERLCQMRRADVERYRSVIASTRDEVQANSSSVANLERELSEANNCLEKLKNCLRDLEEYRVCVLKVGEMLDSIDCIVGQLCEHSQSTLNAIYTGKNKVLVRRYADQLKDAKERFRNALQLAEQKYEMLLERYSF